MKIQKLINPSFVTLNLCWFLSCLPVIHSDSKEFYNEDVSNNAHQISKRSPLDIGGRRTFDNLRNKWTSRKDHVATSTPSVNDFGGRYDDRSDSDFFYSDSATKNANFTQTFTGNPDEYTIGGVLSGAKDVEFYFTKVLSVSKSQFLLK